MPDIKNRNHEQLDARIERGQLELRIQIVRSGEATALHEIEKLLPELTVGPAPQLNNGSATRPDVAVLTDQRHQVELDNIRAAVEASYGRAA